MLKPREARGAESRVGHPPDDDSVCLKQHP